MNSPATYPGGEWQRFKDLVGRLADALLNSLFDLRPQIATIRLFLLIFLFLLSGFLISLFYYPLTVWIAHIQDVFGYYLYPNYYPYFPGNPIENLVSYAIQAFTDPRVLQYLPIFLAPFFIALQTAANYLADIFELEDPSVARHFVSAVALTGSNHTMRISRGDVYEEHKKQPIHLIGGPGRVLVDMDSAALFEKPDGTPRVIGPTTRGRASLDGFERFRQAIDLRPQTIELRDNDGKSASISGRSLDGIPIAATDVCFVFSVHRNGQIPSASNPFPFEREAVEKLVYRAVSQVRPDLPNPSKFEPSWTGGMASLVRSKLGGFMNDHKLTEYLASFGQPEVERLNEEEADTVDSVKALTSLADVDSPAARKLQIRPPFIPRDEIKFDLFSPFAAEFTKAQADRGVELYWIGTGTWMVPSDIVPETRIVPPQYIEAWRISRENLEKGSGISTGYYEKEATVQKFVSLIQEVPISRHVSANTKAERESMMKHLLDLYRSQLILTAEFMKFKGKKVPEIVIDAIKCLNNVLGISGWSWSGPVDPENKCPPADDKASVSARPSLPAYGIPSLAEPSAIGEETEHERSEDALYNELVLLVGADDEVAKRLIQHEQENFPKESRRKWIERARDRLLHDRGVSFGRGIGSSPGNNRPFTSTSPTPSPETDFEKSEKDLYNDLLTLVGHDNDVADRLIEQQQKLFPNENPKKWIERATEKLLHDRGAFT